MGVSDPRVEPVAQEIASVAVGPGPMESEWRLRVSPIGLAKSIIRVLDERFPRADAVSGAEDRPPVNDPEWWFRVFWKQTRTLETEEQCREAAERVVAYIPAVSGGEDRQEKYRAAIRDALDIMATATDRQLGEGGEARRAYARLWHAYFAIPADIPSPPVSGVGEDREDREDRADALDGLVSPIWRHVHQARAERDAAEVERDRLREALEFYAEASNYWYDETCCPMRGNEGDVLGDDGERARAALAGSASKEDRDV